VGERGEGAVLDGVRSLLFAPGAEPDKVEAALGSAADAVIVDLEDTVPEGAKSAARDQAVAVVGRRPAGVVVVRINSPLSPRGAADLAACAAAPPDAVVIPKADADALAAVGVVDLPLVALVETATGLRDLRRVATDPRMQGIILGSLDLAADLGLRLTPSGQELAFARAQLAIESTLARLPGPFDGVFASYGDLDALRDEAEVAEAAGMKGKCSVDPRQAPVINEVFSPSAAELEWARRVVDSYRAAQRTGVGAIEIDGQLVDVPVAVRAEQILRRARPGA
jgi:citrate lyase subunit beta/citryl-CoA lyase